MQGISGAAIMGDGSINLIMDTNKLFRNSNNFEMKHIQSGVYLAITTFMSRCNFTCLFTDNYHLITSCTGARSDKSANVGSTAESTGQMKGDRSFAFRYS